MSKKNIAILGAMLVVALVLGIGFKVARFRHGYYPPMAWRLAQRFKPAAKRFGMTDKQLLEDNLNNAVSEKKLSKEQKDAILAKLGEIEKEQAIIDKRVAELQSWADKEKIDLRNILPPLPGFCGPQSGFGKAYPWGQGRDRGGFKGFGRRFNGGGRREFGPGFPSSRGW